MQRSVPKDTATILERPGLGPRWMLTALVLVQLADAATFAVWVTIHGPMGEVNAFAVLAYERLGIGGMLVLKGAGILIMLALLVTGASRFRRFFHMGAATATSIGLLGTLTNVAALMVMS